MAAAWPATYSDDFNRADSGTLGANWTTAFPFTLQIVSFSAHITNGADSNGNYYVSQMDTADHEVSVVIGSTGANKYFSVMCRMNNATGTSQRGWMFTAGGTNEIYLTERDGATNPDRVTTTGTFTTGSTIRIKCTGTTIEGYLNASPTPIASWSSANYNTNRYVGIALYDSPGTTQLDDFLAQDVGAPVGNNVPQKFYHYINGKKK
jgi:hypothetical protein